MGPRALRPVAIVLLAFLPVVAVGASVVVLYTSSARDAIAADRLARARSIADVADGLVAGSIATLQALAETPLMKSADGPAASAFVTRVVSRDPNWFTIGISDANGLNITSTSAPPRSVNVSDRDYFKGAIAGTPTVGSVIIARGDVPAKIIVIAVPITFDDGSRGILSGGLRLDRVERSLASAAPAGAQLRVIDHRGQEFIGPGVATDRIAVVSDQSDVQLARNGSAGVATIPLDGTNTLVSWATVRSSRWTVILRQPAAAAFAVPDRELETTFGLSAAGLLAAVLVAYVVGRRLQRSEERIEALARAIAAERDELQQLIDTIPQGITLRRLDGTVMANTAARELIGVIAADPLGIVTTLSPRHLDGTPYAAEDLPVARAFRGEEVRGDQLVVRPPGRDEDITVLVSAAPMRRADAVIGVATLLQDISALKALEAQRAEFFSLASHEIKTPVTAMHLQLQILQKLVDSGRTERVGEMVTRALDRSRALAELVSDLLDASRIEAGRLTLDVEDTDLVALVRGVCDTFPTDEQHPVRVVVPARPVLVRADPRRLREIIENLLTNAVKYSPDGGDIDVMLGIDDRSAALRIRDRGFGVPAPERAYVFDRFFRTSRARVYGGVGLGLYISREIARHHGGSLDLESSSDRGSTFLLTLPLAEAEPPSPGAATRAAAPAGTDRR